jgi:predicted TIM-barrel fold metal-dependent hydrolase
VPLETPTIRRQEVPGFEGLAIVDCDVHNEPGKNLLPFLSERWRRYLERMGVRSLQTESVLKLGARPYACRLDAAPPSGGVPGSDPAFAAEQLLDEYGISAAVINNITIPSGNLPVGLEVDLVRATNDYNQAHWLESDPRWLASINIATVEAAAAALEIVRCRERSDRFVQVLFDTHTERPAGNPMYWPIFEAAAACEIPIAFHISGRAKNRLSTGVGAVTYYFETRTALDVLAQPLVASLIFEGVFDRWPSLKVALVEMDWTWAVPLCWRLDATWRVQRDEVPDLQRKPSEYLRDHFWFSTQPGVETEEPEQFSELYGQWERAGFTDKLMFASDYPHWDMDSPFEATPLSLPRETKRKILGVNAATLYGLDLDLPE